MKKLIPALLFALITTSLHSQEIRTYLPIKMAAPQAQPYLKPLTRIGELTGITFKIDDALPPTRAKLELKNGVLDCSVGMADIAYADILQDILPVKEPLIVGNLLVVTTTAFPYTTKADLSGKTVMAIRESAPVPLLQADKSIKFVESQDAVSALRMLIAKRAEVLVLHEATYENALSLSSEFKRDQFVVAPTPYLTVKNLIWFSKKNLALVDKVDAALKQLKASGEYVRIMSGR